MIVTPEMTRVFECIRENMERFSREGLRDKSHPAFELTLGGFHEYCMIEVFRVVQFSFAHTAPDHLYSLITRLTGFDFSLMCEEDYDCPYVRPSMHVGYNEETFGHSVLRSEKDAHLLLGVSHWYVPNTMGHCCQSHQYIWTAVFYGIKRISIMSTN